MSIQRGEVGWCFLKPIDPFPPRDETLAKVNLPGVAYEHIRFSHGVDQPA